MAMKERTSVFLPGIMMPATVRYAALIKELGPEVDAHAKELEVYSITPPTGYAVAWEVDGLVSTLGRLGVPAVHLYGHSAGGAAALAFTAAHPEMVLSLSLDEPAFDFTAEGRSELDYFLPLVDSLAADPAANLPLFLRGDLKEGVPIQLPAGPPPLPNRPAGIAALLRAFTAHRVDEDALRAFGGPVLFTRGTLSNDRFERSSRRLAGIFQRFREEVFEGLSHHNTSHLVEPARVAALLREQWAEVQAKA